MQVLLRLKAILQDGPLQRGRITQIARTSSAHLVSIVLSGQLWMIEGDNGVGLQRFLVPVLEVRRAVRRSRVPGLTTAEFAKEVGLPVSAVWDLVSKGFLKCRRYGHAAILPGSEVERFRRDYIAVPELARTMGLQSPHKVVSELAKRAIYPVCARPTFLKVLYDRALAAEAAVHFREEAERTPKPARASFPEIGYTARQVADMLRLDTNLIRHLLNCGALACQAGRRGKVVLPEEVERVRRAFVSGTELSTLLGKRSGMAVIPVLSVASVPVAHALPNGRYRLYPREAAVAAIEAHRKALALRKADDGVQRMNSGQAQRKLGMTDAMLAQVIRAGLLKAERRGQQVLLACQDLDDFAQSYVLGNELDRLIGSSGGAATKLLKKLGIQPICDRPAFYSVLFQRDNALTALTAA